MEIFLKTHGFEKRPVNKTLFDFVTIKKLNGWSAVKVTSSARGLNKITFLTNDKPAQKI